VVQKLLVGDTQTDRETGDLISLLSLLETRLKATKKAENGRVEAVVYLWFIQKRLAGQPISGSVLCEKAIVFNQQLGGGSPDCKASNFKCRL
jgi:hypothetical protein